MPRRNKILIQVDGHVYDAVRIGRGKFSIVYRVGDRAVYYTKGDCAKEVLAMYAHDQTTHIPELIRHQNVTKDLKGRSLYHTWWVFSAPIYRDVRKTDRSAYQLRKKLTDTFEVFLRRENEYQRQAYGRVRYTADTMQKFVDEVCESHELPKSVCHALQLLVDISVNCGGRFQFDMHKKNFGVNEYGTLIFRDLIWVFE